MAFKAASLVQGGGTGGGRTISNADFEFIYRSLFKAGTGEAFDRIVLLARQEMAKAKQMQQRVKVPRDTISTPGTSAPQLSPEEAFSQDLVRSGKRR